MLQITKQQRFAGAYIISSFTFQHFIGVVFEVLYPPVVTQLCAKHLFRDSILSHINHWVSILRL